ncbi:acetolactate synthase catalytic subunit [Pseudoroseomonas wenyumeiae]|uniref:Acetolactate synthase catalytic subunit n=1 Tax=Teichococcus wenyumeiae TaxID=2478470 RepID=A0A3A9JUS7_9PROT|nr:acetolactate synthase catalytic subunit [Pseudoroseomonas wenyumeiae]RKK02759.1 acetolactate synthase catalytic subunit [Pseudoroseomonas wenyumeiae]RMI19856.1 acetolactate synthase catalytic subunit [Pseudoroseomonas wenyumeiae]
MSKPSSFKAAEPVSNASAAVAIAASLQRHGVTATFGQSLPSALQLANPLFGIRQVAYRTENAGGVMADGYARISHKVGVVTAQNGPAAALLVAPLAEALKVSVPVVAIVQEVARDTYDKNAFQELDHFALFSGCAKWVRRVDRASRAEDYVDMAFTAATSGRPGPAVLLCPADFLNEAATIANKRSANLGHYPLDRVAPDPAQVERAAELLAGARAPLVFAGGGVHLSDAAGALAALQEEAALPVATTNMGKGAVDETHPLSLGVAANAMGRNGSTRHLRPMIERADVVLLIGTRTNQNGTDSWQLYPRDATFIHIDLDGQEVGRNYEALRVVGDARLALEALLEALRRRGLSARHAARAAVEVEIAEGKRRFRDEAAAVVTSAASPLRPERVMAAVDEVLTPETIVVGDASYSSLWITNYLVSRKAGQRFLTPRGLAGLGWGLPMALGAKVAAPEAPVICISGDGGFGHCWAELETARRMKLPVVLILLNNGVLGYQKDAEMVKFGAHTDAVFFESVDHAGIARSCGCHGRRVDRAEDLVPALREALSADRLTLIEVITDPAGRPPVTYYDGHF